MADIFTKKMIPLLSLVWLSRVGFGSIRVDNAFFTGHFELLIDCPLAVCVHNGTNSGRICGIYMSLSLPRANHPACGSFGQDVEMQEIPKVSAKERLRDVMELNDNVSRRRI